MAATLYSNTFFTVGPYPFVQNLLPAGNYYIEAVSVSSDVIQTNIVGLGSGIFLDSPAGTPFFGFNASYPINGFNYQPWAHDFSPRTVLPRGNLVNFRLTSAPNLLFGNFYVNLWGAKL